MPRVFHPANAGASIAANLRALDRSGIGIGDRVAVACRDPWRFAAARQALALHGAVGVPIHPSLTADEVAYIIRHARPVAAFSDEAAVLPDGLLVLAPSTAASGGAEEVGLGPGSIGATIIYTSGTTGEPKGCLRSAEQEHARAVEIIDTYGLSGDDVQLIASSLAHSAPGIFARAHYALGGETVLLPHFDAEQVLAAIEEHRVSFFFMVPTQYARLCSLPEPVRRRYDLSSVRAAIVAGAPCAPSLKEQIMELFGPVLWEFYGSSETGTISVLRPGEQLSHPWSAGRPLPSVEVSVRDEEGREVPAGEVGQIFVRSPTLMSGYLAPGAAEPDPLPADGFLSVSDLGRFDGDGHLHLVDRIHDTIISGGVNVYPAEVERVLVEHPEVAGAVVFGVADPDWGERVVAYYSGLPGAAGVPSAKDLRAYLREHLAGFKVPKELRCIDVAALPQTPSGKPLRRAARKRWLTG